ncbi:MAG: hypothetical protein DWQ35_00405 [Planctomycetota bacterium]|nr:MAG: hypothetical protein DWQ35_00405 [Planctomycetota bacterium]
MIRFEPDMYTVDERRLLPGFFTVGLSQGYEMLEGYLRMHGRLVAEGFGELEAERRVLWQSRCAWDLADGLHRWHVRGRTAADGHSREPATSRIKLTARLMGTSR